MFYDNPCVHWPLYIQYIKTLESQSHLITVPLDVCPTYWPLASHSLSLYPMPDLVCIADANAPEYSTIGSNDSNNASTKILSSSGCIFFNPVSINVIMTKSSDFYNLMITFNDNIFLNI